MRDLSCSECSPYSAEEIKVIVQRLQKNEVRELERSYAATPIGALNRIVQLSSIEEEMKEIAILPWFYDCNRNRYPVWEDGHDSRLD